MRRETQIFAAALAVAASLPLWQIGRKLKRAWDLARLPLIVLRGENGLEVHVRPLGCAIQRILVPVEGSSQGDEQTDDVVLGFEDMGAYAVRTGLPSFLEACDLASSTPKPSPLV